MDLPEHNLCQSYSDRPEMIIIANSSSEEADCANTAKLNFRPTEKVNDCLSTNIELKDDIEDGFHCVSFKKEPDVEEFKVDTRECSSESSSKVQECIDSSSNKVGLASVCSLELKHEPGFDNGLSRCDSELEAVRCDINQPNNTLDSYGSIQFKTENATQNELQICVGPTFGDDCKTDFAHSCKSRSNKDKRQTENKSTFQNHSKKVDEAQEELFQCNSCEIKFNYRKSLKRHIHYKHSCKSPNKKDKRQTKNKRKFQNHSKKVDEAREELFHCNSCELKLKHKRSLRRHIHYKHNKKAEWFFCNACGYKTKRKDDLISHFGNRSVNGKTYSCQFCDHQTEKKCYLRQHINQKHKEIDKESSDTYQCHLCECKYKYKSDLNKHIDYKHKQIHKWYQCISCEYKTKLRKCLVQHFKMQHDENPEVYQCEFCEYKSKNKSYLQKHITRKHSEGAEELYQCLFCDGKYKNQSAFRKHIKFLHDANIEWYHCNYCNLKTKYRHHLENHVRVKHGENCKTYQCQFCEYKSKYERNLRRHFNFTHNSDVEWHKCNYCDHKTKYKPRLIAHYRKKHSENIDGNR